MMEPAGIPRLGKGGHFMGVWIFFLEGTAHYIPYALLCPLGNSPPSTISCGLTWSGWWGCQSFTTPHCSWKLGDPTIVLKGFLRPYWWFPLEFNFFLQIDFWFIYCPLVTCASNHMQSVPAMILKSVRFLLLWPYASLCQINISYCKVICSKRLIKEAVSLT